MDVRGGVPLGAAGAGGFGGSATHGSGSGLSNQSFSRGPANTTKTLGSGLALRTTAVRGPPAQRNISSTTSPAQKSRIGAGVGVAARNGNGTAIGANHLARMEELETRLGEMKLTVDSLERERDFYYGKLREIEVLCQGNEEQEDIKLKEHVDKILEILYATEEGFAVPEDGEDGAGNGHHAPSAEEVEEY